MSSAFLLTASLAASFAALPAARAQMASVPLPLYVICDQVDGKINGWTDHHLLAITQHLGSPLRGVGVYKHVTDIRDPQGKILRANASEGRAVLDVSYVSGLFAFNAVGFRSDSDLPFFPNQVVGGSIDLRSRTARTEVSKTDRPMTFQGQRYRVACRRVSAAEAQAFAIK